MRACVRARAPMAMARLLLDRLPRLYLDGVRQRHAEHGRRAVRHDVGAADSRIGREPRQRRKRRRSSERVASSAPEHRPEQLVAEQRRAEARAQHRHMLDRAERRERGGPAIASIRHRHKLDVAHVLDSAFVSHIARPHAHKLPSDRMNAVSGKIHEQQRLLLVAVVHKPLDGIIRAVGRPAGWLAGWHRCWRHRCWRCHRRWRRYPSARSPRQTIAKTWKTRNSFAFSQQKPQELTTSFSFAEYVCQVFD